MSQPPQPQRSPSERTRVRRGKKRATYDKAALLEMLDDGFLCHVGVTTKEGPSVLPTCYGRDADTLYLHASRVAGLIRSLRVAPSICIVVTHLDGVVLARSAFHHSANYRSVVLYGVARLVDDPPEKVRALRAITEQVCKGRWDKVRGPSESELQRTAVVAVSLDEMSGKTRSGPPVDDPDDYSLDVWAGVVPLSYVAHSPVPDTPREDCPDHVRAMSAPGSKGLLLP